jgi:hypothetical protein
MDFSRIVLPVFVVMSAVTFGGLWYLSTLVHTLAR